MTMDAAATDRAGVPPLTVGVVREQPGESRVALVPSTVPSLSKAGLAVLVERGAGVAAGYPDDAYAAHGATLVSREDAAGADIVVRVGGWGAAGAASAHPDQIVVGLAQPLDAPDEVHRAVAEKLTAFALDLMPRITRAQSMDALSSQATVSGYEAVLVAARHLPKLFPMLTTAAGTVPPAQVLVIGAGVAGLQAIATARRLGAAVQAYDVRPAAQEEIESLGARAVSLPLAPGDAEDPSGYAKELGPTFYLRQRELLAQVVSGMDAVVTTALIPGRLVPVLITSEAVAGMHPGAVIVDCAAERGGNCELTRPGEIVVTDNGVTIDGPTDLPSRAAHDASLMYAKNVTAFLLLIARDGVVDIDEGDEIVAQTLVARGGEIVNERILHVIGEPDHV
jgi:NAD(P) transhydrogenase subunit alpha